jgi:hypothetical protein
LFGLAAFESGRQFEEEARTVRGRVRFARAFLEAAGKGGLPSRTAWGAGTVEKPVARRTRGAAAAGIRVGGAWCEVGGRAVIESGERNRKRGWRANCFSVAQRSGGAWRAGMLVRQCKVRAYVPHGSRHAPS